MCAHCPNPQVPQKGDDTSGDCIARRSLRVSAQTLWGDARAYETDQDHAHLLVTYPPKVSLSKLVMSLNTIS
ncbi:transposase [Ferrithrix thermotolerans]|uniref:transposase n=1 Tax=Ferrithrix thermotolerans TaxID=209649 RepID=UPI000A05E48C